MRVNSSSLQRERYQAVQSFDITIWTIFIYIWFLDGSTLALFARILMQTAFCNQSTSSLPSPLSLASSLFGVLFTNSIMFISHSTTNVHKLLRSKSIFIDFIAKETPPSNTHLVLLDVILLVGQTLLILLVDGTNRADLQKDDWRGDIDGLSEEELISKREEEDDLEGGRSRNEILFDEEEGVRDSGRLGQQEGDDEGEREALMEETGSEDIPTRRNESRSPYTHPIAVITLNRAFKIITCLIKNQLPKEGDLTSPNNRTGDPSTEDEGSAPRLNPELREDDQSRRNRDGENRRRVRNELRGWAESQSGT